MRAAQAWPADIGHGARPSSPHTSASDTALVGLWPLVVNDLFVKLLSACTARPSAAALIVSLRARIVRLVAAHLLLLSFVLGRPGTRC